ncbi:hypothetical protein [Sphingomonas sp. CCH5-D11]|uniref:hypothetical protein n=1 Tax=Sphingomonas sp. CCH5-D11 TaxID=1768786 RepID=UPI0012E3590D|nr:hypothetical protein [Sphingomonas sp. CCH5-D11]
MAEGLQYGPSLTTRDIETPGTAIPSHLLVAAKLLGDLRQKQEAFLGRPGLFSDPGWDILLSILIDEGSGRPSYVKSVTIAARLPDTTGLEWIRRLELHGLIISKADAADRRRRLLSLSMNGRNGLLAVLRSFVTSARP